MAVNSGPLGGGGTPGTACAPAPLSGEVTDGLTVFQNSSSEPVTIERVRLSNSQGLTLVGSLLVPTSGNSLGVEGDYPPQRATMLAGIRWTDRVNAAGAIVPPSRPGTFENLAVGLRLDPGRASGKLSGVEVFYKDSSGGQYEVLTGIAFVIDGPTQSCKKVLGF